MTNEIDIRKFYKLLDHKKQTEIRAINPNNEKDIKNEFVSNEDQFVATCIKYNKLKYNVYAGINERELGGTKKEHVKSVKTLVIDIDPIRPKHTASTDEELQSAIDVGNRIIADGKNGGFNEPAVAMSGNGVQLYYTFPEQKASLELEQKNKNFLAILNKKHNTDKVDIDTAVGDLPRIIKVIGTKSYKGVDNDPLRPQRVSKWISIDGRKEDTKLIDEILSFDITETNKKRKVDLSDLQILEKSNASGKEKSSCIMQLYNRYKWNKAEMEAFILKENKWVGNDPKETRQCINDLYDHYADKPNPLTKEYIDLGDNVSTVKERYKYKSLDEIMTEEESKAFLVKEMIYPNTVNSFISASNGYKSLLAMYLALCVARGEKFFTYETTKSPVLVIDNENNKMFDRHRFECIKNGMGIKMENLPIYYSFREGKLSDPAFVESVKEKIKQHGIKLVIVDTLLRSHNKEENSNKDMNILYDAFCSLQIDGCSVLFLHHTGKDLKSRGASDILGQVDSEYMIGRKNPKGTDFSIKNNKNRMGNLPKIVGDITYDKEKKITTFSGAPLSEDEEEKDSNEFGNTQEICRHYILRFMGKNEILESSLLYQQYAIDIINEKITFSKSSLEKCLGFMTKNKYLVKIKNKQYVKNTGDKKIQSTLDKWYNQAMENNDFEEESE